MELDKHSLITELQIKVINMADPHDTGISRQTSTGKYRWLLHRENHLFLRLWWWTFQYLTVTIFLRFSHNSIFISRIDFAENSSITFSWQLVGNKNEIGKNLPFLKFSDSNFLHHRLSSKPSGEIVNFSRLAAVSSSKYLLISLVINNGPSHS